MGNNRLLGLGLTVIGIAANNYVYHHDVILGTHEGLISLGWQAYAAIVVSLAVIAAGLVLLVRAPRTAPES